MGSRVYTAAVGLGVAVLAAFAFSTPTWAQTGEALQRCAKCHEDQVNTIAQTRHGAKGDVNTPTGTGKTCDSCHGDMTEHLKAPTKVNPPIVFGKGKATPAAGQSGACMTCHSSNRHLAFWESGRHGINDVTCNNCHQVHAPTPPGARAGGALVNPNPKVSPLTTTGRQLEYPTCGQCHKQITTQIFKPSHHPIWEGKVFCSDCHNPHGALTPVMLKHETINSQCLSCHTDKRGPYMFEHPAVEENCLNCHRPHGSSHGRLLNERVPNLCQDCHDWSRHPGTAYAGNQGFAPQGANNTRFIARSCLNCHNAIHGSNAPANRGRFLTR
jgi:DmsE family decaheme c-type cytochrome